MQIKWLKTALQNLDDEMRYVSSDSPQAAELIASRIFRAIEQLSEFPALGRPGRLPGTRELIVPKTRYLVPYRVTEKTVEILRIFHSSRRPPARCAAADLSPSALY